MAYHYTDPTRATDPHALPDVEVFFDDADDAGLGPRNFDGDSEPVEPGWYFAYLDGGLDCWSGEPSGPYPTEAEALAAAREGVES